MDDAATKPKYSLETLWDFYRLAKSHRDSVQAILRAAALLRDAIALHKQIKQTRVPLLFRNQLFSPDMNAAIDSFIATLKCNRFVPRFLIKGLESVLMLRFTPLFFDLLLLFLDAVQNEFKSAVRTQRTWHKRAKRSERNLKRRSPAQ